MLLKDGFCKKYANMEIFKGFLSGVECMMFVQDFNPKASFLELLSKGR